MIDYDISSSMAMIYTTVKTSHGGELQAWMSKWQHFLLGEFSRGNLTTVIFEHPTVIF